MQIKKSRLEFRNARERTMATDLVSQVTQLLTPEMINRIATALGLDRGPLQSAVRAAIPAMLAGLSNVAAQPGGAQKIAEAARQQSGAPGILSGVLAAGSETSFAEKGALVLSSLIGGGNERALASAVGKFAGIGQGASKTLIGMLAPLVLGSVGRQARDPISIPGLLASQKDNI